MHRFAAITRTVGAFSSVLFALSFPALSPQAHTQLSTPPALPLERMSVLLVRSSPDSIIRLPHTFVAPGTDTVVAGPATLLRGRDYTAGYGTGTIVFNGPSMLRLLDTLASDSARILIWYRYLPLDLRASFGRRVLITPPDTSLQADSIRFAKSVSSFTAEDIFGPNLQKSGSIVRGFTVGSNRDLSLNSGLRLQLSGKILQDVEVTAALTDENTPIQPEGTTQTLQEFDKVFVEIKATDVAATLGDFTMEFTGTEFARLSRKLQGAKGFAQYRMGGLQGATTISGAVTRGKYTTKQFTGLEGVQGPYQLTGANNERSIIVIAGTERVYIDGELQTRGETNDYTIDYSTAELTFTPRRMITSASRLTVDFEYTDRQYSRSLFAVQSTAGLLNDRGRLTVRYVREADDPDSPIDFIFTDSARAALARAGNDRDRATLSGVTRVDSNGSYAKVDTVLAGGTPVSFYRYAPGDSQAVYAVTFSYVGASRGDYARRRAGLFEWRGPGKGDYLPITYLPLPQSQQLVDIALDVEPADGLRVKAEFGHSVFDANRLSPIGDAGNGGNALFLDASYQPRDVRIGGASIGGFDLHLRERFVESTFVPVDRANDIEFTRRWGVDSLAKGDEEIQEAALAYLPVQGISIGGSYGKIRRGDLQRSSRTEGTVSMKGDSLPTVFYTIERVDATDRVANVGSKWVRQKGRAEYSLFGLTPGVRYEGENRLVSGLSTGAPSQGSFKFDAFTAMLRIARLGPASLGAEFTWRIDNVFLRTAVLRESQSFTQSYTAQARAGDSFSTAATVTLRTKSYSPDFRQDGRQDIQSVLVRSQTRAAALQRGVEADVLYEVSTEQASRLERVYVRVTPGTGNYRYLGDVNGNGLADDGEFVLSRFDADYVTLTLPTDEYVPIIDLRTSARLRVTPNRFVTDDGFLSQALRALTSESYVRIEEKSSERDLQQIYLLHFSRFQQDATTIAGSILYTQDVHVFEGRPEFSLRFRFSERHGLTNFSGGIERAFARERSVRIRWQLVAEIANQIDLTNRIDRVDGSVQSPRVRDILSNALALDFSYRPQQNVELGMKFDVTRSTDRKSVPALDADFNAQTMRFVVAFQGAGQARAELAREEIRLARGAPTFPYELTGGRVSGKTWVWRAGFDYRITQFLQATMSYEGRTEGGRDPIHTARAEVRAFF